jgi:hypothetical protein
LFFRGGKPAGSKDHKRFYARDGARSTRDWPANPRAQVVESARKLRENGIKPAIFGANAFVFEKKRRFFASFFHPPRSTIKSCGIPATTRPPPRGFSSNFFINNLLFETFCPPRRGSVSRET